MRLSINYLVLTLLSLFLLFALFSCSDDDIMLYHPKPEPEPPTIIYLLDTVDYPADRFGLADRGDLAFTYDDDNEMNSIETIDVETYNIDNLSNNLIAYSKQRESSTTITYDSLLIQLDNTGKALYSRHVTYSKPKDSEDPPRRSQNDSVHFTYNGAGYLTKMESFSVAGGQSPRYTEEYTIDNGNRKGITVTRSNGEVHSYSYTYDNTEYYPVAKYAYEMPFNTHSQKLAGCIMVTNLLYFSDYLGVQNKNNITGLIITKIQQEQKSEYANISYRYTVDEETGLVTQITIAGTVNDKELPEDYTTNLSYLEKIEEKE